MDVRCEKCQTEYELDESRLKPGGVTVKCTNCGHMFKIRKRTPTNVEIVNKALNPGASDPNVPLPRADLSDGSGNEPSTAGGGPRVYGRGEDGGAVLGLRVPIPADRNASGATARYGAGEASPNSSNEAR